jgi:hypothetical protein
MLADFEDVLDKLEVATRNGERAISYCPTHDDHHNPSLSLKAENGRLLLHCFAGCRPEDIVSKVGLRMQELFVEGEGVLYPPKHACTLARSERKAAYQWAKRACSARCTP